MNVEFFLFGNSVWEMCVTFKIGKIVAIEI